MAKGNKTKKSRMSGVGARIQDLAGKAVRGAYKKATPQLQVANRIAQFVKPESGIAKAIKSVAQPKLPSGRKKVPSPDKRAKARPVPTKVNKNKARPIAKGKSAKGKVGKNRESKTSNFATVMTTTRMPGESITPKTKRMPSRMKKGGVAKKAAGGMIKDMMPPRGRPPEGPPRPPRPIPRPRKTMVRTEAIDPRLPRGKAGKGPAEPTDSRTQVISQPPKKRKKFLERVKRNTKKPSFNPGGGQPAQPKGPAKLPGAKDGGMMKAKGYKDGGAVNKRKATGAAKRGFGKAYMKGKR